MPGAPRGSAGMKRKLYAELAEGFEALAEEREHLASSEVSL